uniref:Eukaryotic translation initiation factor 4B n=1 Tax=Macaca nemestrina TaxID=9545 RepID=A0A2K6B550_MACNE
YGGLGRCDDRGSRDSDGGCDSRTGSGGRAFGRGYRRDDDYRGRGDRYEDRYDRQDDESWNDYSRDEYGPKLNLTPPSTPKKDDSSAGTSQAASIFRGAKPVDTAAREREIEEPLQREREKLQRQLDKPNKTRTTASGETPKNSGTGTVEDRNEKSLENETLNKEEDCHSPTSKPPKPDQPLKVMPAPPPKENAWVKRSSNPPAPSQSSDTEQQSPASGGGKVAPAQRSEEGPARKDENKVDGMNVPKGQTGSSSCGPGDGGKKNRWKESDRKDGKKDQDSRSAPEPKKPEENPASNKSNLYPDKTKQNSPSP